MVLAVITSHRLVPNKPWWRHDMETFSVLLSSCERMVTGGFPSQNTSNVWSFDVFFIVNLKKLLKKQSSCCWFWMPWCSYEVTVIPKQPCDDINADDSNILIMVNTLRPRQMAAIFQTTFSNAFSLMKMYPFRLIFHWSLFPMVKSTIFQHWFR